MSKKRGSDEPAGPLTKEAVLAAIAKHGRSLAKRDLARVLDVKGEDRRTLRLILEELEEDGKLARAGRRTFASADAPPESGIIEITGVDDDGDLAAQCTGDNGLFGPMIRVSMRDAAGRGGPALGIGDRALARISKDENGWNARIVRQVESGPPRILGIYRAGPHGGMVEPSDRRARGPFHVSPRDAGQAKDGDLVISAAADRRRASGPPRVTIIETIGRADDPRAASILAMHAHRIPVGFSEAELAQARAAKPVPLGKRTDLRDIPLVTIDPDDARDHDDAVFAAPDDDPKNAGGWKVLVAIADVALYVTPDSPLDKGALKRGVSVYFPDRVSPMLPEELSADLCSLREGEDRACLAVEMVFDAHGDKRRHTFMRGMMRSAAKLEYTQAQRAIDGEPDEKTAPLLDTVLKPLWAAYAATAKARDIRNPLDLDAPEFKVRFGPDGKVASIHRRERVEAHRLIEEFMIQANVCAAETLEAKKSPLIYRIHDTPSQEKIAALTDFLPTINMKWTKGEAPKPHRFNKLIAQAQGSGNEALVNEMVLRSQAQAIYSDQNIGHFGLNLDRYAHFTSPIRRYADVIVHRGLIRALGLGDDGLTDSQMAKLDAIAEIITTCERRAVAAEREANDRYVAAFLADKVGAKFQGRITGVTRAGLFIRLTDIGADGLAPISMLGDERFAHDAAHQRLIGEQSGDRFVLGMTVEVRLVEATPVSGGLLFEILTKPQAGSPKDARNIRPVARDARARPGGRDFGSRNSGSTRPPTKKSVGKKKRRK
ncbi:MAG: ribonuclease R [Caulobacterales bacterium]